MDSDELTGPDLCGFCKRRIPLVNGGAEWLYIEVTRNDGHGGIDTIDEEFCSQQHAADWLAQPLPAPVPADMSSHSTWKDRLISVFIVVSFGWGLALMLLGSYALVRLLGGWDG